MSSHGALPLWHCLLKHSLTVLPTLLTPNRESDVAFVSDLAAQYRIQAQGSLLFAAVEACIRADCVQSAYALLEAAVRGGGRCSWGSERPLW